MSDRSSQLRSTEERLQDEVRELRGELRRLQVRVDRQEDEIWDILSECFLQCSQHRRRSKFSRKPRSDRGPSFSCENGGSSTEWSSRSGSSWRSSWTTRACQLDLSWGSRSRYWTLATSSFERWAQRKFRARASRSQLPVLLGSAWSARPSVSRSSSRLQSLHPCEEVVPRREELGR